MRITYFRSGSTECYVIPWKCPWGVLYDARVLYLAGLLELNTRVLYLAWLLELNTRSLDEWKELKESIPLFEDSEQ
jgi:hypothetical protein